MKPFMFVCWCSLAGLKKRDGFRLTGNTNNGVKQKHHCCLVSNGVSI